MSFSSLVIVLTFTPVPSSISNRVTVGPLRTATTRASTLNCSSIRSSASVIDSMFVALPDTALPLRSRSRDGSS